MDKLPSRYALLNVFVRHSRSTIVVNISTVAWFHHPGVQQKTMETQLSKNAKSDSVSFYKEVLTAGSAVS
jgi:hypothetical protein